MNEKTFDLIAIILAVGGVGIVNMMFLIELCARYGCWFV